VAHATASLSSLKKYFEAVEHHEEVFFVSLISYLRKFLKKKNGKWPF